MVETHDFGMEIDEGDVAPGRDLLGEQSSWRFYLDGRIVEVMPRVNGNKRQPGLQVKMC